MDDFFDYAIANSHMPGYAGSPSLVLESHHPRPGPSKQDSSDTMDPYDSGGTNLSVSEAASSAQESPDTENMNYVGGQLQLIWSDENQELVPSKPTIPDQHHEKSCPRCSLTETEARKCRLDRRREQNRESQRKFRARKEAKIREAASQVAVLETYVEFLEKHNNELEEFNAKLQQRIANFNDDQHTCTLHTCGLGKQNVQVKGPESRESRPSLDALRPSAADSNSVWGSDMHLSLFDHELLPPVTHS